MTTATDDKGVNKRLPADDVAAIYDTETRYLYLYARGTWTPPSLIKFVPQFMPPFNQVYALEGWYTEKGGPVIEPSEHQFAERFGPMTLPPWFKTVTILTANSPPQVTVDILHVPVPPQEPPS